MVKIVYLRRLQTMPTMKFLLTIHIYRVSASFSNTCRFRIFIQFMANEKPQYAIGFEIKLFVLQSDNEYTLYSKRSPVGKIAIT